MTDGGSDPTSAPPGAGTPWPAPPPGNWGASPTAPPPSAPTATATGPAAPALRSGRRRIVEMSVVVVLTGAIVALAFTVVGGKPRESAAESKFTTVGNSIERSDPGSFDVGGPDSSSDGFTTIPLDEDEAPTVALKDVMPTDDDVVELLPAVDGDVFPQSDLATGGGTVTVVCSDVPMEVEDGWARAWTAALGYVEVDIRIHEATSAVEAEQAMDDRTGQEFLDCLPGEVHPIYADGDVVDGKVIDHADTGSGDHRQISVLIEDATGRQELLVWRQVGRYTVSARIIGVNSEANEPLALDSADDLLDLPSTALED